MGQIVSLILKLADYITDMFICMKIQYYKNNFNFESFEGNVMG